MPDPIFRTDRTRSHEHDDQPPAPEPQTTRPNPRDVDWNAFGHGSAALDHHLDKSLDTFVKNKNVMMLGMNETRITGPKQNDAEWAGIQAAARRSGVGAVHIAASYSSVVALHGQSFDLSIAGQGRKLAAALGIPDENTTRDIGDVLENAPTEGRDELARIAMQWACAERPGTAAQHSVPARLMFSGHCGGSSFYDGSKAENQNEVTHADIQALARAMPHASAQVRDVMFSACSTMPHAEKEATVAAWREAFPNLQSMQGYGSPVDYHSPTGDLAIIHERVWLYDTRSNGGSPHLRTDQELSSASHVMIWKKGDTFEVGK